jgi:hypothetical protein
MHSPTHDRSVAAREGDSRSSAPDQSRMHSELFPLSSIFNQRPNRVVQCGSENAARARELEALLLQQQNNRIEMNPFPPILSTMQLPLQVRLSIQGSAMQLSLQGGSSNNSILNIQPGSNLITNHIHERNALNNLLYGHQTPSTTSALDNIFPWNDRHRSEQIIQQQLMQITNTPSLGSFLNSTGTSFLYNNGAMANTSSFQQHPRTGPPRGT